MARIKKRNPDYYFIVVAVVALFFNFFQLNKAGTNEYYTVAVKSMLKNFHNFFYASFDPAGFITVDKPPVALWLQALSAKLFGFSNFSVLLPGALAGVASCLILYQLVKKKAGPAAALISGIALALTPIFTTVARTNNVDSVLILTLMVAAWAVVRAADTGKMRWLIVSVLMVGIGFNVKMLEAFMVLPAVYLFYWLAMKTGWRKKIIHLVVATIVLAVVSLSWAVTVDLVPASERPYIGSSQTNSVLELAFGYNGISRLTGNQGNGMHMQNTKKVTSTTARSSSNTGSSPAAGTNQQAAGSNGSQQTGTANRGGNQGGMFGTGTAGPLRLFSESLSGQASWLLPFVLFGLIALVVDCIRRRHLLQLHTFAIFWLAWLLPAMAFFSVAGFFHQYYLSLLGPPIAALFGIGAVKLWQDYRKQPDSWTSLLLPAAACFTLLFEALIFYQNSMPTIWTAVLALLGLACLAAGIMMRSGYTEHVKRYLAVAGLSLILIPPLYWTMPAVFNQTNSSLPSAGPSSATSRMASGGGMPQNARTINFAKQGERPSAGFTPGAANQSQSGAPAIANGKTTNGGTPTKPTNMFNRSRGNFGGNEISSKLLSYLEKHYNGEKYILAVQRAQSAYSVMLKTNYAVMAMGGFTGSDPAMTVAKLEKMAKAGEIKYFLISGGQDGAQNSSVNAWIVKHCTKVQWSGQSTGQSSLYKFKN
ncbi:ArnT family glycosyltransferase [Sporolactobacillus vineae]|uniref:ArnT family glycosyltransferase n=1 Tax=Sporolactobacillus vineae TaxID=444463 RepID=UPI00028A3A3A|nr:glycosyltransferase family 39 protein [Sporolactobacillus vineae]